ncbi:MAG TPA: zinc ABC transporter substrate-binding protein [Longimicrobiales bacterium]|nr:zinc ABC transporter substrate-binding protein [Longimicrobiales bacterium]
MLLLTGCDPWAEETEAAAGRLRVVATIGMIADVAAQVGGDRVFVQGLMGPGVDPHLYKARAGDVRRLSRADLVLYNGLHLEAAMGEVLEEMGRRRHTVAVAESVPAPALIATPDFGGSHDPHVWFDVALWSQVARRIEEALAEADPAHAAEYAQRGSAYRTELGRLDAWVRERVAAVPPERRVLITAHDAFGYFGRAYGFEVMGLQGISTSSEAGTGDVQRLVDVIVTRRIPAIFLETSIPPRNIRAVVAAARSRGFALRQGGELYSDALGDTGTPEGTYLGMVRHNVETIVNALVQEAQ